MAAEFCPRCGRARLGSFRFCRHCGFDFDTASPPGESLSETGTQARPAPANYKESAEDAVRRPAPQAAPDHRGEMSPLVSPAGAALGAVKLSDRQWSAVAGAAGLIVAVAGVLPWVTVTTAFGSVSRSGLDGGDGLLFLGGGIVIALLGLSGATGDPQRVRRSLLGLGLLGLLGGIAEFANESSRIQGLDPNVKALTSIGVGIYLAVIGGLLGAYAAWRVHPK